MPNNDDHRHNKYDTPETRRSLLNVFALLLILFSVLGYVIYLFQH